MEDETTLQVHNEFKWSLGSRGAEKKMKGAPSTTRPAEEVEQTQQLLNQYFQRIFILLIIFNKQK